MKKIIFLGGLFSTEYSFYISMIENGINVNFLIDPDCIWTCNFYNKYFNEFVKRNELINIVSFNNLISYIKDYNPDLVIHRLYKGYTYTYDNIYDELKILGIPYLKWCMETDYDDNNENRFENCDIALYTHNTEFIKKIANKTKTTTIFFPYGVSSIEQNYNVKKYKNFISTGLYREDINRKQTLDFYLNGIKKNNYSIDLYSKEWENIKDKNIFVNNSYSMLETIPILNRYKACLNIESLHNLEGAYSYKMFQSIATGVPTVTFYKKTIEDLFGQNYTNMIYVKDEYELDHAIKFLMYFNAEREQLGKRGELYMHENFDWYTRFNYIIKNYL